MEEVTEPKFSAEVGDASVSVLMVDSAVDVGGTILMVVVEDAGLPVARNRLHLRLAADVEAESGKESG